MRPDLVGTPGFDFCLKQGVSGEAFQDPEMSLCGFAPDMVDDCAVGMPNVLPQQVAGGMLLPGWRATNEGMVFLADMVGFEKHTQRPMGDCGAGEDDHTTGTLIQAVDDPYFPVGGGELIEQVAR